MTIERIWYCEGPECLTHIRTSRTSTVPIGFLLVTEGAHEGDQDHHFCGWDCVMRYAAALPPPEVIELP